MRSTDVVFGLEIPSALRLQRRVVLLGLGLILHRRGGFDHNLAQFLFLLGAADVVAPQARLRFERQLPRDGVFDLPLFAVNESGQPLMRAGHYAPAIEVEVEIRARSSAVSSVEADDMEVLILHPDSSHEAAFAGTCRGRYVKHQAANVS